MNRNTLLRQARSKSGFTLIELLVAVGVTALMVSLMLTIVVNVMGGWSRSSGSLTSGNQARTVLDILSRDLQSAIFKRDGSVWLAATIQSSGSAAGANWSAKRPTTVTIPAIPSAGQQLPSLDTDYKFGQAGVWLRFIATIPGTNSGDDISAPRAISYQMVRRSVSGSSDEQSYMLFRSELTPAATFNSTDGYNLYGSSYATGVLRTPNPDDVIANNVVDFGIRCLKRNTTGQLELIFPDPDGSTSFAATSDASKTGGGVFPDVVEVFVRVLTDEGAQQVANFEAGRISRPSEYSSDDEYWWAIVNANSRAFSRRVEIKATSL